MANPDALGLIGAVSGNRAGQAWLAGALNKATGKLAEGAEKLGAKAGEKFGTPVIDAFAKGAGVGQAKAQDDFAKANFGLTIAGVRDGIKSSSVAILAAIGIAVYLAVKRR